MKLEMTMGANMATTSDIQGQQRQVWSQYTDVQPLPPDRKTRQLWHDLAAVTVNEHGLMRDNCRCRVCRAWWRFR